MLTKEMIKKLNETAVVDFDKAKAMLDGINMVLGTKYGWLAKRVVFFDNPDASACFKYCGVHDAEVWAD